MRSIKDLESQWLSRGGNQREEEARVSLPFGGKDFLIALHGFHIFTQDQRFSDAISALKEHGILDKKNDFKKKWKGVQERNTEDTLCVFIDDYHNRTGLSVRRVCAEIAAEIPLRGNSFDAAIKRATVLYRNWIKGGGRQRCAHLFNKLEKIPPTKNPTGAT